MLAVPAWATALVAPLLLPTMPADGVLPFGGQVWVVGPAVCANAGAAAAAKSQVNERCNNPLHGQISFGLRQTLRSTVELVADYTGLRVSLTIVPKG